MASSRGPSTANIMAKTFLECIELSEGYTDYPIKPAASCRDETASCAASSWHSPRISFSNEFAQINNSNEEDGSQQQQQQINSPGSSSSHKPSSSGEFEFNMAAPTMHSPLSADELFYKGKLLPLHLPPRIRMVQDLCEDYPTNTKQQMLTRSPALAMMRRERSLRSPARPVFVPTTLKSSSYPPPGYSSRPTSPPKVTKCAGSSSRWRDLFGFKKPQANHGKAVLPPSSSTSTTTSSKQSSKFLKMIFNRGSTATTGSTSSSSSGNLDNSGYMHHSEIPHRDDLTNNGATDALVPLLRDDSSSSCPVSTAEQMMHSSSTSSTSSSSNWAGSSASSSTASTSSFSADFPEISNNSASTPSLNHHPSTSSIRKLDKLPRNAVLTRSSPRRRGIPPRNKSLGNASKVSSLTRSGSIRRPGSSTNPSILLGGGGTTSSSRMQLQDHMNHMNNNNSNNNSSKISTRPNSDNWRRPENSKTANSSVRVTPVLHVPACIGPSSLRNVKVHGFRRLFSSSSTSGGSGKPDNPVAVM